MTEQLPSMESVIDFFDYYVAPEDGLIFVKLGVSATVAHQILNAALDNPAAYEYNPLFIKRMRRRRAFRRIAAQKLRMQKGE